MKDRAACEGSGRGGRGACGWWEEPTRCSYYCTDLEGRKALRGECSGIFRDIADIILYCMALL